MKILYEYFLKILFYLRKNDSINLRSNIFLKINNLKMPEHFEEIKNKAQNGCTESILKIAIVLFFGRGVKKNLDIAYELFSLLEEDPDAEYYMGKICCDKDFNGGPDYDRACEHYLFSYNNGKASSKKNFIVASKKSNDIFWKNIAKKLDY